MRLSKSVDSVIWSTWNNMNVALKSSSRYLPCNLNITSCYICYKKGILYNWIYFLSMRVACIFIMTASQSHKTQDSQRQTGIFKCIDQKSLLNTDWFVVNSNGSGPLRVVWSQFSVINYHSARVRNRPPYWNHLYHSIADADIYQQNKFRPS